MKSHLLQSFILILLLSSACTGRVELNQIAPHQPREVSVSFGAMLAGYDALGLRAAGATAEELTKNMGRLSLKGIRIVFYKQDEAGNPTEVAYAFRKEVKIFNGSITGSDAIDIDDSTMSLNISGADKVTIGDYTVLFFTSPSESLIAATEVGKKYSDLKQTFTYEYSQPMQGGMHNLGFNLYTNVDAPLTITAEQLTEAASSPKPYPVIASRLSAINAFVYINFPSDLRVSELVCNSDINALLYLDTQNRKFTLFPTYQEAEFDKPLAGVTSYRIPKDANYEGFATKSIEELRDEFIYLENGWGSAYKCYSADQKAKNYIYAIPENTLASSEANGKAATRLIIGISP